MMRTCFSLLLKATLLVFFCTQLQAGDSSNSGDLDLDDALGEFRISREKPKTETKEVTTEDGESTPDQATAADVVDSILGGPIGEGDVDLADLTAQNTQDAVEALNGMVEDGAVKSSVAVDSRIISAALLFQNFEELKTILDDIVQEISVPGDPEFVKVAFNSSVYPSVKGYFDDEVARLQQQIASRTEEIEKEVAAKAKKSSWYSTNTSSGALPNYSAGGYQPRIPQKTPLQQALESDKELNQLKAQLQQIRMDHGGTLPEKPFFRISVSAGALAFIETKDELVALISQQLAKINPTLIGPLQDKVVREILLRVKNLKDVHKEEQEIIKSDLATVDRLGNKGYNPWALQRFEARVLEKLEEGFLKKRIYALNRGLMSKSLKDAKEDPLRPARHAAMEAWIGKLTEKKKDLNKTDRPLPSTFGTLHRRLKNYVKPMYSLGYLLMAPVAGTTAVFAGGPILATLGALAAEGLGAVTIAAPAMPWLAGAGALVAEFALGTFGAVTAAGTLYAGYKNRDKLGSAARATTSALAQAPGKILLGTKTRGQKLLTTSGNALSAGAQITSNVARGTVALGASAIQGTVNGTVSTYKWTKNGIVVGGAALGRGIQHTLIGANRVFVIAPYNGAQKRLAYITDSTKQFIDKNTQRSRALTLYRDFELANGDSLSALSAALQQIHQDFENQSEKTELLNAKLDRTYGVFHPMIKATNAKTVIRAASTRSYYFKLLIRLVLLIENQDFAKEDLDQLFTNYEKMQVPKDISDSSSYQELLVRMGQALKKNLYDDFFSRTTFDTLKINAQSESPKLNLLQQIALFSMLNKDIEDKNYSELLRWPDLLSKFNFQRTAVKVISDNWKSILEFYIENEQKLTEEQKQGFQTYTSHLTPGENQSIPLRLSYLKKLSSDTVLVLAGKHKNLKIKNSSALRRATQDAIKRIIEVKGSIPAARSYISSLVIDRKLDLGEYLPLLFSLESTEALRSLDEVLQYNRFLIIKEESGVEIPTHAIALLLESFTKFYPRREGQEGSSDEFRAQIRIQTRALGEIMGSQILTNYQSKDLFYDPLLSTLVNFYAKYSDEAKILLLPSDPTKIWGNDPFEGLNPLNYFHNGPSFDYKNPRNEDFTVGKTAFFLSTFEKYNRSNIADFLNSREFLNSLKFMAHFPLNTHKKLKTFLSEELPAILHSLTSDSISSELSADWLRFIHDMTLKNYGRGFKLISGSKGQGWTLEKVVNRSNLRKTIQDLGINQKASLLTTILQIENAKSSEDKTLNAHLKTFFKTKFLQSKALSTTISQFATNFVKQNTSLKEIKEGFEALFPNGFKTNPITVVLLREIARSNPSIESFRSLLEFVALFYPKQTKGISARRVKEARIDMLDIIANAAVRLMNEGRSKNPKKQFDDLFRKMNISEEMIQSAFIDFPRKSLIDFSLAQDKSDRWPHEGLLDVDPPKEGKSGRLVSIEYLAIVSRAFASLKTEFNAQLLLKLIPHLIYLGARDEGWLIGLKVTEEVQVVLAQIFTQYGNKLAKYALSTEANIKERNTFFSLVDRISYDKKAKLTNQMEKGVLEKFNGTQVVFKGREINKIVTRGLTKHERMIWNTLRHSYGRASRGLWNSASTYRKQIRKWAKSTKSMVELDKFVRTELQGRGANMQELANDLFSAIQDNPQLLTTLNDAIALLENDSYWPEMNLNLSRNDFNPEEVEFIKIIRQRQQDPHANKGSWTYPPAFSEKAHAFIAQQLKDNNQMPRDFKGLLELWISLTNRGVSSVSDHILDQIMKVATDEQTEQLEDLAIKEQRIFETTSRDQLVLRKIKESQEYYDLINNSDLSEDDRFERLQAIVEEMQSFMPERGLQYEAFLEELSVEIMSSQRESQYLHQQKTFAGNESEDGESEQTEDSQDNSLQAMYKVIQAVGEWKDEEKFNFLLYLRGDAPATDFLRERFPTIGVERVKRMYEILPVEYRVGVINFYLGRTFFKNATEINITKGYPRRLIEQAITSGKTETDPKKLQAQEVTRQILLAGLNGIKEGSGDAEFQKLIVANILAVSSNSEGSIGQTLKLVLEKGFGPLGVKIGQLIVAMNILEKEDAQALLDVQDNARPLQRQQQFEEFEEIVGELPFTMRELLGSASIKWAIEGRMNKSHQKVAIKVFREEVEAMLHNRYKVLESMVDYLVKNVGPEYKILKAIVDSAKRAVEKELDGEAEVQRSEYAKTRIYVNLDDETSTVKVPKEAFESGRIIISEFVEGTSFHRLPESIKHLAAAKILTMEGDILFADEDEITFDPDRHGGNYRIHLPKYDGKRHVVLEPIQYGVIDFGQLITIKKEVRTNLIDIFALSQIISESGTNQWLTEKLGRIFNLQGDKLTQLGKVLRTYFPNPKLKEQTAYFAALSALHEVGVELDPGYFDFARAVMQLMQYEPYVPKDFKTPSRVLESKIVDKIASYLRDLATDRPTAIMARNAMNRVQSMFSSNKTYRPITTQIDSDAVMAFKFDGSVWESDKPSQEPVVPAVFGFTCEAQFR